jgi:hypothetical protein
MSSFVAGELFGEAALTSFFKEVRSYREEPAIDSIKDTKFDERAIAPFLPKRQDF